MLAGILCAMWIESACANRDAQLAMIALAECRIESGRQVQPSPPLQFTLNCMETKGLRYRVNVTECPLDDPRLESPFCWRRW